MSLRRSLITTVRDAALVAARALPVPASPTLPEEPAMPGRTRKPTTTVAEAAAAPADPPVAAGKKPKAKAASPVQSILTSSEAGAADATFLPALPVGRITPSPDNPRDSLPDLDELRDSIAEHGLLEPIVVAEAPGAVTRDELGMVADYDLIFGHRRLAAAQAAGLDTLPAVVRNDLVDRRADVARLVENLQRADLNPLEEAKGIARLVGDGMAQKDVAVAISRNPGHVTKRLQLLKLVDKAQAMVAAGALPLDVAVDLSRLPIADQTAVVARFDDADGIARATRQLAEKAKAAAELEKVAAQLRKAGLTVIVTGDYPRFSIADGPYQLELLRNYGEEYSVPARHDKLPCHIAVVAPSWTLGRRTTDELDDDPLSAYYRLACSDPGSHKRADADSPAAAGTAGAPADRAPSAEELARDARNVELDALLEQRWTAAQRALAAKPKARVEAAAPHIFRVNLVTQLEGVELDDATWAATAALLYGDPAPSARFYHQYETDLPGVRDLLSRLHGDPADLERFAYANALAAGHVDLDRALRAYGHRGPDVAIDPDQVTIASLHLRHLADLAGGGIPADVTEQAIVLAGADLVTALLSWGLLAPPAEEDPDAGRPVEDVHLPDDGPGLDPSSGEPIAELVDAAHAAATAALEPDLRRAELGVTRDAEADYTIRLGGGYAYLIPGLKTAKGQCATCHAQVPIVAGGKAGKHRRDGDTCPGVGSPVMTLDQARPLPEQADGEPDEAVDAVACPTCDGVGRDASDARCRTCEGKGLVMPQLV